MAELKKLLKKVRNTFLHSLCNDFFLLSNKFTKLHRYEKYIQ